jgi:transcriptional regulator with PAS, ATPase and Fis domain
MNEESATVNVMNTILEALKLLGHTNKTELPVVEKDHLIGVLRLNECMKQLSACLVSLDEPIRCIVQPVLHTVNKDFPMPAINDTPVYIVEGERLLGEISSTELIAFQKVMTDELARKKKQMEWYELCFESAYEGLAVVDKGGVIQLFNKTFSRFADVTREEAIGKKADKVIENTRLLTVLKTGVPERSQAHRLQGQNLIVHRLPLWRNNEVIGAVGMLVYEGVSEIYQAVERMETLEGLEIEKVLMAKEAKTSHDQIEKQMRFEDILGESPVISETKHIARKAARTKATVLITGESGVGKEQFARAIHDTGITSEGNFVSVNCAAIPDNLLESELFGYAKGAFTGASKGGKIGKFELAHNGTLFLDEIGDMPMAMQVKILRVIQERMIERVGGTASIPVNFRLIAATNKNLKNMVAKGEFREDLYYRLFVIPIHIPPLKDRKQDIPIIIANKMQQLADTYEVAGKTIDQGILRLMGMYDWPGNVRELMNVLERLFVLTDTDHITMKGFPESLFAERDYHQLTLLENQNKSTSGLTKTEERNEIQMALEKTNGNKTQAAKLLGISRATLYNRISRFFNARQV